MSPTRGQHCFDKNNTAIFNIAPKHKASQNNTDLPKKLSQIILYYNFFFKVFFSFHDLDLSS